MGREPRLRIGGTEAKHRVDAKSLGQLGDRQGVWSRGWLNLCHGVPRRQQRALCGCALTVQADDDLNNARAGRALLEGEAQPDQQSVDRSVAREHRGRESDNVFAARPSNAGCHESPPDALVLEFIGDRDRNLGGTGAIRLETEMADDLLPFRRTAIDDRHEPLPMVVIRRAERDGLSVAERRRDGEEPGAPALPGKPSIELLKPGCVGGADCPDAYWALSALDAAGGKGLHDLGCHRTNRKGERALHGSVIWHAS